MNKEKKRFSEVLQHVKSIKKDVKPNEGFVEELMLYEKELFGSQ